MDNSPISGFITRKQASEQSRRAERTLQRYWSKAMELNDQNVLSHLKLRSEHGEIIDGPAVTKERIEELRTQGKNPTWYAEADWVLDTYGPRANEQVPDEPPEGEGHVPPEEGSRTSSDPALIDTLRHEIDELRRDKDRLYTELNIKNEQIKEANARTRESNTLMQDLQKMLGNWQDQAFRSLPASVMTQPADRASDATTAPTIVANTPTEKGNDAFTPTARSRRKNPKQRTTLPDTTTTKPKWYETPTIKRFFSRSQ